MPPSDAVEPRTLEHTPSDVRLYGPIVQRFYRWTSSEDPRGVVDFHAVPMDRENDGELWLHTHGAQKWDLPNLEIVGVPRDVGRAAEDLIWALLAYARSEGPIRAGEDFAGFLVGGRQETMHLGEFAAAPDRDPPHDGMLRVVDPGASAEEGFPHRLMATHICATAEQVQNLEERASLFRRAIGMHPGGRAGDLSVDDPGAFAELQARTNIGSWEGLARTLAQQDAPDAVRTCLEQTIVRAPSWAAEVKENLLESVGDRASAEASHYAELWSAIGIEATAETTEPAELPPGGAERLDGWKLRQHEAGTDGVVGMAFFAAAIVATIYLLLGGDAGSGPIWTTGLVLTGLQGWCVKEAFVPSTPDAPYRDELIAIANWAARLAIVVFLIGAIF